MADAAKLLILFSGILILSNGLSRKVGIEDDEASVGLESEYSYEDHDVVNENTASDGPLFPATKTPSRASPKTALSSGRSSVNPASSIPIDHLANVAGKVPFMEMIKLRILSGADDLAKRIKASIRELKALTRNQEEIDSEIRYISDIIDSNTDAGKKLDLPQIKQVASEKKEALEEQISVLRDLLKRCIRVYSSVIRELANIESHISQLPDRKCVVRGMFGCPKKRSSITGATKELDEEVSKSEKTTVI